ncbi:hypothetical protein HDV63DRAFT_149506 [Trichoderma sp. SZMC 28014]
MVSHRRRPKAGGRQNSSPAQKTPQNPEVQQQSNSPRHSCVSCRSIGARCNGGKPCSHCEVRLKTDCAYEDPDTCYPTIYKVKKDAPQQAGNNDTNKAPDRAFGSNTTHKVREIDEPGFRKQLDELNAAHALRSKVSNFGDSSLSQNAPPLPTAGDAGASTDITIQPPEASAPASMGPPPPPLLTARVTVARTAPSIINAHQPASIPVSKDAHPLPASLPPLLLPSLHLPPLPPPPPPPPPPPGFQVDSRPSSIKSGHGLISNVPNHACHLIDEKTGSLRHDQKVAVVDMMKQLRSALKDAKPADKKARKPILPPYELSLYLLRVYHKEVYYLFPFICFSTFLRAYRNLNGDDDATTGPSPSASFGLGGSGEETKAHSLMFRCALFTMLSHASKFAEVKESERRFLSRAFWECACAHFTPVLVKENSLAAVQTFLIVAVSFNSTRFSGDERRIPMEIAYRLAQHMMLDDDDDGVARSSQEKEIRMKAWYGCVMMISFIRTGVNFHFPLASGVGAETLVSADRPLSGSIPFSFFTGCIAHCEELGKVLQNMPKMRSHVLSGDPASRYPHNLAELLEMFAKFQSVLPASLDWTTIGVPVLEVDTSRSVDVQNLDSKMVESQTGNSKASDSHAIGYAQTTDPETETSQTAVCNTSFMLIRSMLFCPVFMEAGIQECLAAGEDISTLKTAGEQKAKFCASECLKNAVHLINYMHRRSTPGIKNGELGWWDPYHVGTAGLVIVMAQTSESLWASFDQALLQQAWKFCQELLVFDRFDSSFKRFVAELLWKVNSGITKGRVLINADFTNPQPPSATKKGKGPLKTLNFDMDPLRLEADGSIRVPCNEAQIPSGLPYEDYMNFEMSPRTRMEHVLADTTAMGASNAFDGRPSLTPSVDTDLAFTPSTDLDFTFTPSMMEMDFSLDPNLDGNPTLSTLSSTPPFNPAGWDSGSIHLGPASIPTPNPFLAFARQPLWTAEMWDCYDPAPASSSSITFNQLQTTASMGYNQPVPGPGASGSDAPPLRVMHFNPSLPTDHGQSAFSKDTPSQAHADYYTAPAGAAAFNGGNIFLNGLKRKRGT